MTGRSPRRVRVKICGVTRPADAERAVALGADFLGLNFWPESSRRVDLETGGRVAAAARAAAAAAGREVSLVGVFVNEEPRRVERIAAAVGLDLVQLHGDEGPAEVARFGAAALKALRFSGPPDAAALAPYAAAWGFLVESRSVGAYGGVGRSWDYGAARALAGVALAGRPLLIAGGLGPENVGQAIAVSDAWGVDVASGVESAPGVKDPTKLEKFFQEVRHAER